MKESTRERAAARSRAMTEPTTEIRRLREALAAIIEAWSLPADWDSAQGAMNYTARLTEAVDKARVLLADKPVGAGKYVPDPDELVEPPDPSIWAGLPARRDTEAERDDFNPFALDAMPDEE